MDCHRCENIRYGGCPYGRCIHPGHQDVRLSRKRPEGSERPYNMQICPDFRMKKRCSNCKYWIRGAYYSDGVTPAKKGRCSLRCKEIGKECPLWKQGPTSWRKKTDG